MSYLTDDTLTMSKLVRKIKQYENIIDVAQKQFATQSQMNDIMLSLYSGAMDSYLDKNGVDAIIDSSTTVYKSVSKIMTEIRKSFR